VDAFAGGGIVGLTAAAEGLIDNVVLIERDPDIAAVWVEILSGSPALAKLILNFRLCKETVDQVLSTPPTSQLDRAFATILRNRVQHGGVMTTGAGRIKAGENGKGLSSRWYPETLARRIEDIQRHRDRITFIEGDAFGFLKRYDAKDTAFFFDPPYTIAGRRLYTYSAIDHEDLIRFASDLSGSVLMTYDNCPVIRGIAHDCGFPTRTIPMKTNHHTRKEELLISSSFDWLQ
jgi:DNA adenine methylase